MVKLIVHEAHLLFRSIYFSDISQVQLLSDSILSQPLYAFPVSSVEFEEDWGEKIAYVEHNGMSKDDHFQAIVDAVVS